MIPAEVEEVIQAYLKDIRTLEDEKKELESYVADECVEHVTLIKKLEQTVVEAEDEIADVKAAMREAASNLYDMIDTAEKELEALRKEMKAYCYSLPVSLLKSGLSTVGHNYKVSVHKTATRRAYMSEEMIQEYPELLKMSVDGDPVVSMAVNPAILDRLVAEEKFSEEDAQKFLIETKIRNPSIRITEVDSE